MDYTDYITSEYVNSTNFVALVGALTNSSVNATHVDAIPPAFDLNNAVGAQLDIVGLWVGVSRVVSSVLLLGYFGFADDEAASPFGELTNPSIGGRFYDLGDQFAGTTILPDIEYQTILAAKIIKNQYNGGLAELESAMFDLFGVPATIVDDANLSIIINVNGTVTQVQQALIATYDLLPRPAGVPITAINYT